MDHVHLFICPTLFTHVPRTGTGHHSSPPVPSCWSSLQAAWDEMNQLLPLSQVNPHKAHKGRGWGTWPATGWGSGSGHILRAFLDEGGQVGTKEDPLQVTSETESEPHLSHLGTSS